MKLRNIVNYSNNGSVYVGAYQMSGAGIKTYIIEPTVDYINVLQF